MNYAGDKFNDRKIAELFIRAYSLEIFIITKAQKLRVYYILR